MSLEKVAGDDRLMRAAKDAVKQVEGILVEMARSPRKGTVLIEMLGDREQVLVKPTPFFTYDGK